MQSMLDSQVRLSMDERLDRLTLDHTGAWGRLTVGGMVCHLYDSVRVALGENPSALIGYLGPLRLLVRWLGIDVMPWPKGKVQTVPEMLSTRPGELKDDVERLKQLLDRLQGHGTQAAWGAHPLFGALSEAQWGRLVWRHVDYHLRQFGV
jgi:hypothetical protein